MMKDLLFLVHVGATLFFIGLIWTIQIVHYPLFASVGESGYAAYQTSHMSRITYVVAPVMLAGILNADLFRRLSIMSQINRKFFWFGLALVLMIWASTAFIQSPIHGRLAEKFDADLVQ